MSRKRVRREFAYIPSLPNPDSSFQTLSTKYLDAHYASLLLKERWTWERYARFCRFLKYTPYELASLVMLPHKAVKRYEVQNVLEPKYRANLLLLTLLEAHLCGQYTKDVIANPFPDLNKATG